MLYWLLVPFALSIGLLVYVYSIHPQGRSTHLFALFMLAGAADAVLLLITTTTDSRVAALWASIVRQVVALALADLLFWFLAVHLAQRSGTKPGWVDPYTLVVVALQAGAATIASLDLAGRTAWFYGPLVPLAGRGYVAALGPLYAVPHLVRLATLGGAALLLAGLQGQAQGRRLSLLLLLLALLPLAVRFLVQAAGRPFTGAGALADFALYLGLGLAAVVYLFAPVEQALRQAVDSMSEGVVVLDAAGHVLQINHAAEQILHVNGQRMRYRPHPALFDALAVAPAVRHALNQALDEPRGTSLVECQVGSGDRHQHLQIRIQTIHGTAASAASQMLLISDVTALVNRSEELEAALKTQEQLAAMTVELSSPVLPVMQRVIVLPIVGTLTAERTQQILQTLFEGIHTQHALIAILDLTGVRGMPAEAADILQQAIHGSVLLGAHPVLVGVQPQVAEALTDLNLDLAEFTVLTDLRAGLAYAAETLQSRL